MKLVLTLTLVTCSLAATLAPALAADSAKIAAPATKPTTSAAWRPLFNGKDLAGWKVEGKAHWRVEDGVILGTQDGDARLGGLLATDRQVPRLRARAGVHDRRARQVQQRRLPPQRPRHRRPHRLPGQHRPRRRRGILAGVYTDHWLAKGDEKDTIRKPLQWNTLRIVARGPHLVVDLNGVNVVDLTDDKPEPKFLQPGVIGLQTYGAENHPGWVKFRNLRIRELVNRLVAARLPDCAGSAKTPSSPRRKIISFCSLALLASWRLGELARIPQHSHSPR